MDTKVSIILPTYNGSRFIREAVDSIVSQDFENWELVIIDDCSTDDTPSILAELAQADSRIHVYRNAENKKLPASINAGFSHTVGEYVTWTSDDNMLGSAALSTMVKELDSHPDVDLVYCDIAYIDQDGQPLFLPGGVGPVSLLYFYNTVQACFMYRRGLQEELGGYDESLFLVEDYDFWLRANRSHKIKHIKSKDTKLYLYRTHPGSLTSTRQHDIREKACMILKRELHSPELPFSRRALASLGYLYNSIQLKRTEMPRKAKG